MAIIRVKVFNFNKIEDRGANSYEPSIAKAVTVLVMAINAMEILDGNNQVSIEDVGEYISMRELLDYLRSRRLQISGYEPDDVAADSTDSADSDHMSDYSDYDNYDSDSDEDDLSDYIITVIDSDDEEFDEAEYYGNDYEPDGYVADSESDD